VAWSCNCPVGEEGTFCKHCVAVALEEARPDRQSKRPDRSSDQEPDGLSVGTQLDYIASAYNAGDRGLDVALDTGR